MFDYHEMSYIRMLIEQCEDRSVANGDTASAALTQTILGKMPAVRDTGPFEIVPSSRLALADQVIEAARKVWTFLPPDPTAQRATAILREALESYDRSAAQKEQT